MIALEIYLAVFPWTLFVMDAVKLTFPLDEFAFVIILGKSNAKSCSYFISFDLPLLILNFVAKWVFFFFFLKLSVVLG
jgi:hypothetical protein